MPKRTLEELIDALKNMGASIEKVNEHIRATFADTSGIDIATFKRGIFYLQRGSTVIYPPQYGYVITGNLGNGILLLSPARIQ